MIRQLFDGSRNWKTSKIIASADRSCWPQLSRPGNVRTPSCRWGTGATLSYPRLFAFSHSAWGNPPLWFCPHAGGTCWVFSGCAGFPLLPGSISGLCTCLSKWLLTVGGRCVSYASLHPNALLPPGLRVRLVFCDCSENLCERVSRSQVAAIVEQCCPVHQWWQARIRRSVPIADHMRDQLVERSQSFLSS